MANVQHKNLPDSELHELKGVATALADTVPVADGAGNSSWQAIPGTAPNVVTVSSLSDFPTPSGGIINCASNTVYRISGNVNIASNRINVGTNTVFLGSSSITDGIESSTTGAVFTANSVNLVVTDLLITCTQGSIFSFTGTPFTYIRFTRVTSNAPLKIGAFSSVSNGVFESCSFTLFTDGITFTGTGLGSLGFLFSRFAAFTNTAIDLGTAVLDTLTFNTVVFTGEVGSTDVSGTTASGNITTRASAIHCTFSSNGTPLSGITSQDLKYSFNDNIGVSDSRVGAQGYITASALNTTFAAIDTPKIVNFGTTFTSDIQNKFTISNTGRFTYNGVEDTQVFVESVISALVGGGTPKRYNYYIVKNGVPITSSISSRNYDGSNPGSTSCSSVVELSSGDYIELWVEAKTSATDLNVDTISMKIVGI